MKEQIFRFIKERALWIGALPIATYFLSLFHIHIGGFPAKGDLTVTSGTYLALFVFFFVLPLARRFKLAKFIDFEAKVDQVRTEVKDVRTETRELVSTMSNVANAISTSMRQTVVVNVPDATDAETAREDMAAAETSPDTRRTDVLEFTRADDSDVHYALARLRMDLEREIRRSVEALPMDEPHTEGRSQSIRSMFRRLASDDKRYERMQGPLDFVLRACNAAIHGQNIDVDIAYEAIDIGLRILEELRSNAQ